MTCHNCLIECKRHGRDRKGSQRFQCSQCSKTCLEPQEKPLDGMYLPIEKAEMILKLLLEGNGVSSVERITTAGIASVAFTSQFATHQRWPPESLITSGVFGI